MPAFERAGSRTPAGIARPFPLIGESSRTATHERVYHAVKAHAIAYEFPEGGRIALEPIARRFGVGVTAIREALDRLAEEKLVVKGHRKGYYAMQLSAENLQGYYELSRLLLTHELKTDGAELRNRPRQFERIAVVLHRLTRTPAPGPRSLARYTGEVFACIAGLSGKPHVVDSIERANDHLYYIRTLECEFIVTLRSELVQLCELLMNDNRRGMARLIDDYHESRIALLPRLFDSTALGYGADSTRS